VPRSESYNTKAHREIQNYLEQNWASTVSAADILQYLKENGTPVNATTVYRYLEKLCSEHAIIKYVASKGQKSVYQLSRQDHRCSEHLHLKCTKCGKILHLDCGFMDEFKDHLKGYHDFQLQYEGNILYGVCSGCSGVKVDK